MKRSWYLPFLTAVAASFCLALAAHGQSGPGTEPPKTQPAGVMSEAELEAAIKALDPSYRAVNTQDGKGKIYYFKITRDGWSYDMMVESFQGSIWINAKLSGVINAPENLKAASLAELIKLQGTIRPKHFYLAKAEGGYVLYLGWNISRQISAEVFTNALNNFLGTVKETYPIWSQVR